MRRKFICLALMVIALTVIASLHVASVSPAEEPEDCGILITYADSSGTHEVTEFAITDTVYVKGEGMEDNTYNIYVVPDVEKWSINTPIPTAVATKEGIVVSDSGFSPVAVWEPNPYLTPGDYDIIADNQNQGTRGVYDVHDALGSGKIHTTAGFFVIPGTQLGTVAVLLAGFASLLLKKRTH